MRLTCAEMAAHLGLPLPDGLRGGEAAAPLSDAVTDSREARAGSLFVCMAGERVDGHDFAAKAVENGAAAVLAQRPLPGLPVPVLVVEDTVRALGQLAGLWRSRTGARVVGITGTCGKTTLKETVACLLSVRGKTARTLMNHNNQIGLPRDMLRADGDEAFWVLEAGISHEGDMDALGSIIRPDIALILNVGPGHTAGLGKKGVAWHKARLLSHAAPGGQGLVSADYPELVAETARASCDLRFFSAGNGGNFRGADYRVEYLGAGQTSGHGLYRLFLAGESCRIEAPFQGAHGAENCIAAAACAHMLGLAPEDIAEGFRHVVLPPQRFHCMRAGIWEIVDDTYNANPLSMRRMLDAAVARAQGNPFFAVLGEMGELGAVAGELHGELGRHLATLHPAAVFWKGGHAEDVRTGLNQGGYEGPWFPVAGAEAFMDAWKGICGNRGGLLLFKGSRANRLENLLEAFLQWSGAPVGDRGHVL